MTFNTSPDNAATNPEEDQAVTPRTGAELAELANKFDLPTEITIDPTNQPYTKEGVTYGGPDHLPELPSEIDFDFPPAPPEINHVL